MIKNRGYCGYEIFPDRFHSSIVKENMNDWEAVVKKGLCGEHQYDFYGGDLKGITIKADYIKDLGMDFLYMTPIFKANTNHRYDCVDFFTIDPLLGSESDFKELIRVFHEKGMRVVVDGVFNHIGMSHPWFKQDEYADFLNRKDGKVTWWGSHTGLPELNLENRELRNILWNGPDSVVKKWTDMGVDDWRLDCAYDVGYEFCRELRSVLKSMGDHNSIGEIWSYPGRWIKDGVLDGVMNYYFRELIVLFFEGKLEGSLLTTIVDKTINECSLGSILKSWNVLSSHDTARVKRLFGKNWRLAVALQFTLPGSPLLYYGEELGLDSDGDPHCRQPMPWADVDENNEDFRFYKRMIELYNLRRGIHSGSFGRLDYSNKKIMAFSRFTEDISDYTLVVINPTAEKQDFQLISKESSLMNGAKMKTIDSGKTADIHNSIIFGSVEPHSFDIYELDICETGYSPYKRL